MFLGEYEHSLDAKGRLVLPAAFRAALAGGVVMSPGLDGCVAIQAAAEFVRTAAVAFPAEEFALVATGSEDASRHSEAGRWKARSFFGGAREATPDGQGRIAIPPKLRDHAGLHQEVIVAGMGNWVEIWNPELFRAGAGAIAAGSDAPRAQKPERSEQPEESGT